MTEGTEEHQDSSPLATREPSAPGFLIRLAESEDAELEQHALATADAFRRHLFGPDRAAEAAVAEVGGEPAGFALWFETFSTFRGQPGLYLEDIFVRPGYRGGGIGKALLATVARRAVERGCGRLEWSVLNWNDPAIGFYRSLGARPMDEWTVYRIDDEPLERLAKIAPV
jgi:GNAT superfamily N-acetyltransferase